MNTATVPEPRTAAALAARRRSTETALKRVREAITRLRREKAQVSVAAVARRADVSRTFLYGNPEARAAVASAMTEAGERRSRTLAEQDDEREATWRERALNAEGALRAAHGEILAQRTRIGELLGQIRDLQAEWTEETIQRITTENTTLKQRVRQLTADNRTLDERLKAKNSDICGTDMSVVAPLSLSPQHPLTDVQQQLDGIDLCGQDAPGRIFPAVHQLLTQLESELSTGHTADMDTASHQAWELVSQQATDHASLFGAWRMRERARTVITHEFLNREYDASNRSLPQIAKDLGLPYPIVIERYKELGRSLKTGCRPRSLDDHWLREQYLVRLRSTREIGRDIGTSEGPVKRRLVELGVTLRPVGAHSRREVLARLDESVPRDIRAAVEGTFHGWLRLRRFQIHMAFPSLQTTAAYLETAPSALAKQKKQLETAIGARLLTRAATPIPHQAAIEGAPLLRHLDEEHVQELMRHALGPDIPPMPTEDVLANAIFAFGGNHGCLSQLPPGAAPPARIKVPPPCYHSCGTSSTAPPRRPTRARSTPPPPASTTPPSTASSNAWRPRAGSGASVNQRTSPLAAAEPGSGPATR
ncbi:DUF6262 family protein [Streptomyces sp. NPDC096030]|uniref:DUF6262 family protein n=1 Tax=Streptomyces sp. NPDC096030 TaxID=3155423 RepID=UPI00331B7AB4